VLLNEGDLQWDGIHNIIQLRKNVRERDEHSLAG